jgi:hypothetical protein
MMFNLIRMSNIYVYWNWNGISCVVAKVKLQLQVHLFVSQSQEEKHYSKEVMLTRHSFLCTDAQKQKCFYHQKKTKTYLLSDSFSLVVILISAFKTLLLSKFYFFC